MSHNNNMGSKQGYYEPSSTPPKLALFSFPNKAQEPAGMLTPPIHTSASIPFKWEEAPGKPRPCTTQSKPTTTVARCLELPPRLFSEAKVTNMPSPTTVLDGPYMGRSLSYKLPFVSKGGSFRSPEGLGKKENKERIIFGSSRWGSFKKNKEVVGGSFDFSSSFFCSGESGGGGGGGGGGTNVKITRVRRKASFLSFSQSSSHMWTNIYESFKQVVPWRRKQEKMRKMAARDVF